MPAIAPHSSATTDAPWNAASNEGRIKTPVSQMVAAHFWAWREAGDWPEAKAGFRFPHHEVSAEGAPGAANVRACSGAIAVLNGARGGTNIPAGDKQGVYDHLAKHLRSAGQTPPALGADADESEAWALGVEATDAVSNNMFALPAGERHDEPALLPLGPLGRAVWAIPEDALAGLIRAHKFTLEHKSLAERVAANTPQAATRRLQANTTRTAGAVAVIPLCGVITPRGSLLSMLFGGGTGGLMGFREQLAEALGSPDVGAIVLDVDSPGGLVNLVPETAAMIREARGSKPIVAVANTMAASAAYWLAAQADEVVVTPSGRAGSIGVYMVHEDWSGWNAQKGIVPTYVKAGRFKAEGNPDEPLSDEAQAAMQQEVDDLYGLFVESVARGRGVGVAEVRAGYGEGRCLFASRALEAGLCDRVASLEEVIGGLLGVGDSEEGISGAETGRRLVIAGKLPPKAQDGEDKEENPEDADPAETEPDEEPAEDGEKADPEEVEDDEDDADTGEPAAAKRAALLFD